MRRTTHQKFLERCSTTPVSPSNGPVLTRTKVPMGQWFLEGGEGDLCYIGEYNKKNIIKNQSIKNKKNKKNIIKNHIKWGLEHPTKIKDGT